MLPFNYFQDILPINKLNDAIDQISKQNCWKWDEMQLLGQIPVKLSWRISWKMGKEKD